MAEDTQTPAADTKAQPEPKRRPADKKRKTPEPEEAKPFTFKDWASI